MSIGDSVKKLNELLDTNLDIEIESIEEDSRIKGKNILFCCIKGLRVDGHDYVEQAIKNGAVAILCEKKLDIDIPQIVVDNTSYYMNVALNNFYNKPTDDFKLVAVTGTDGKTTIANMIYQIINYFEIGGMIGTEMVMCPGFSEFQTFTTPFPKDLYRYFDTFNKLGCKKVVMEASSDRLGTGRLDSVNFDISIYTNLKREHLDNHGTFENYLEAKTKLFQYTKKNGACIINNDDEYNEYFKDAANAKIITYGINTKADLVAQNIVIEFGKLFFEIDGYLGHHKIYCPLSGKFNVSNLLAVIIATTQLGYDIEEVIKAIRYLKTVPGRQEIINLGQPFRVMIDLVVTGQGWEKLYEYVKPFTSGKIIAVLGAKGERYEGRHIDLGNAVSKYADYAILTSENPKSQDPYKLITDVLLRESKPRQYEIIIDRDQAIKKAISIAQPGDSVLITGKAHENYQEIKGEFVPYAGDTATAQKYIKQFFVTNK